MKIHLPKKREIHAHAMEVTYTQSSGPGGQNVNKVATKVQLKVRLSALEKVLHPNEYTQLTIKLKNRIDQGGYLSIYCDETRHQKRNLALALQRIEKLIRNAIVIPKKRRATRPTRSSNEKRLTQKKHRSEKKKNRGPLF